MEEGGFQLDPVVGGHTRVLESWGQMAAAEIGGTKERMDGWGGENERSQGCWPELMLHSRLGDGAIAQKEGNWRRKKM